MIALSMFWNIVTVPATVPLYGLVLAARCLDFPEANEARRFETFCATAATCRIVCITIRIQVPRLAAPLVHFVHSQFAFLVPLIPAQQWETLATADSVSSHLLPPFQIDAAIFTFILLLSDASF